MQLLINRSSPGLAAHIADIQGRPLCKTPIKLTNWLLGDQERTAIIVCRQCLRAEAKIDAKRGSP
jgi:hypothetical protein